MKQQPAEYGTWAWEDAASRPADTALATSLPAPAQPPAAAVAVALSTPVVAASTAPTRQRGDGSDDEIEMKKAPREDGDGLQTFYGDESIYSEIADVTKASSETAFQTPIAAVDLAPESPLPPPPPSPPYDEATPPTSPPLPATSPLPSILHTKNTKTVRRSNKPQVIRGD